MSDPGEPAQEDLLGKAREAQAAGRSDRALTLIDQALARDPHSLPAWHLRAALCMALDRLDDTAEALARTLALDPGDHESRFRLAVVYQAIGRFAEAIAAARSVPADISDRAALLFLIIECGRALDADGMVEPEASELEKLLAPQGEWSETHERFVEYLRSARRHERALEFLKAWLQAHGAHPVALLLYGNQLFHAGRFAEARKFFAALAPDSPWIAGLIGDPAHPRPAYSKDIEESLARRIAGARADFAAGKIPLPEEARRDRFERVPESLAGKRILLVGPAHICNDPRYVANDMLAHFKGSGLAAGLDLRVVADDLITYPAWVFRTDSEVAAAREAFFQDLLADPPDLLILDGTFIGDSRSLNSENLARLKLQTGCRVAVFLRDARADHLPYPQHWLGAADFFILFDPLSPLYSFAALREKLLLAPVPVDPAMFRPGSPKNLPLLFVGATENRVRPVLLSHLLGSGVEVHFRGGDKRADKAPDFAEYARLIASARASLNISAHSFTDRMITGRVWETLACGTLLLEQNSPSIERFLVPGVHFLGYENGEDMVEKAKFAAARPDISTEIAAAGHAFWARHYNAAGIWTRILAAAFPEEI